MSEPRKPRPECEQTPVPTYPSADVLAREIAQAMTGIDESGSGPDDADVLPRHVVVAGRRYQLVTNVTDQRDATERQAGVLVVVLHPAEIVDAHVGGATAEPYAFPPALRLRFGLTNREARIAERLAARRSNKEIAVELRISPHTARRHTERVLRKLGVATRREVESAVRELMSEVETLGVGGISHLPTENV